MAVVSLETTLDVVGAGMQMAREEGARTILDPAPARELPRDVLAAADVLTPNETEACILMGRPPQSVSPADAESLARALRSTTGVPSVVIKLGENGCYLLDGVLSLHSPG